MSSSTAAENKFLEWFKSTGGTVNDAVGFKQFDGMGRGAVALQDIEVDTLLFSIPRSILLTTSTSALPSLLPSEEWQDLSGWTPLILSMMYERLRTSTWTPYFDLLPEEKSFNSLMFWSDEELKELTGSTVLSKIGKDEADQAFKETVKPFVKKHENVFGNSDDYTLQLFHYTGSLVLSRSFHVDHKAKEDAGEDDDSDEEDEEEEREDVADVAAVPFADLLNAKSGCDNARLFYEPRTLNMMSTSRIPAGAQIFNTYADPPNSDLLRRYGHVDEVNDADLVEVGLEEIAELVGEGNELSDEDIETRAEFLLDVGIDDVFAIETNHSVPDELVSAIRAFILTSEELAKCQKKESPPKPKVDWTVADWTKRVLAKREEDYETTIETDEKLLKDSSLPPRKRMAIIVRLGEKRILRATRLQLEEEFPWGSGTAPDGEPKKKKRSMEGQRERSSGKKSKKVK
ncbi:ribosomal lysine N-methyltransferase [Sporobolomyces salmoneus]|uniref:ribosomal lysine N-methyltransferase n=1 Tax=Sporobolomyces salmoneus TaxID=183962 RepID=UPI00317B0943